MGEAAAKFGGGAEWSLTFVFLCILEDECAWVCMCVCVCVCVQVYSCVRVCGCVGARKCVYLSVYIKYYMYTSY